MSMTVTQMFEALPGRFLAENAGDLTRTVQWHITDAEPGIWAFEINQGKGRLIRGGVTNPDTTLTTTTETWTAITEGRQDPMRAFMTGKLSVEGDMMLAAKLQKLFDLSPQ